MKSFATWIRRWLSMLQPVPDPATLAVAEARALLGHAATVGRPVPDTISGPIFAMQAALASPPVSTQVEQDFYVAYTVLTAQMADISKRPRGKREYPFENAVEDAELLLKHAAETGINVDAELIRKILAARTALKNNEMTDQTRGDFYSAYSGLSKSFGDVTAETIRSCSSSKTRKALRVDWCLASCITAVVALVSVGTFVANSLVKKINDDVPIANDLAAKLRAGLTDGNQKISSDLANDPCSLVDRQPDENSAKVRNSADITQLQEFAGLIREIQSRSVKLNSLLRRVTFDRVEECDSNFSITCSTDEDRGSPDYAKRNSTRAENQSHLQIHPAITNYSAEVLCRIKTYQEVRTFATVVRDNYTSVVGAFTSYALPILYALLGAYAYRLRLFADTVRKRAYHPSFANSARMITAVIAGAICGLFNPAQGLALSPLAVAFLVGYGVELFFKLLDTLINSFGQSGQATKLPK